MRVLYFTCVPQCMLHEVTCVCLTVTCVYTHGLMSYVMLYVSCMWGACYMHVYAYFALKFGNNQRLCYHYWWELQASKEQTNKKVWRSGLTGGHNHGLNMKWTEICNDYYATDLCNLNNYHKFRFLCFHMFRLIGNESYKKVTQSVAISHI